MEDETDGDHSDDSGVVNDTGIDDGNGNGNGLEFLPLVLTLDLLASYVLVLLLCMLQGVDWVLNVES